MAVDTLYYGDNREILRRHTLNESVGLAYLYPPFNSDAEELEACMRTFRVYAHPTRGSEAVKVGFSWPAFWFGGFWMLAKKLWGYAIAWFSLWFVLSMVEA